MTVRLAPSIAFPSGGIQICVVTRLGVRSSQHPANHAARSMGRFWAEAGEVPRPRARRMAVSRDRTCIPPGGAIL